MPIRKGNHSKRRYRYFRGSSKRDPAISPQEEARRYDIAICQYCPECMENYALTKGKIPRKIGVCGICGKDGYISGSLYSSNQAIVLAKMVFHNSKRKGIKNE